MPGIIRNNPNQILADPGRFNPFDTSVFQWYWDDTAPDEDTFGPEHGVAHASGLLKNRDALFDALAFFVGFSTLDTTGGQVNQFTVKRHNPAVYPRWPMMRCSQVSIKGVQYDGTPTVLRTPYANGQPRLPLTQYKMYRFDCAFEQPQIDYLEDSQVTSEWDRCRTTDNADENEVVTVDGGFYRIHAPSDPTINNLPNTLAGPSMKVYVQRSGLIIKVFGLPADFVLNQYGLPVHFMDAKGKVNSTTFLGLPAGTMLLQNYDVPKKAQPVATADVSALQFGVTVTMHFGFTNPTATDPAETLKGWQLWPVRGVTGSQGWYAALGESDNKPIYDTYDMNRLLQYWAT